jgi:chromosome segregation ATPase
MSKVACPFLVVTLAIVASARAQSTPPGRAQAADRDAVVAEVRLLRQAVERQTAVLVRSQLLVSRLLVLSQRVSRAQAAADRAADALDAAEWQQTLAREAVANTERAVVGAEDAPRRSGLERELEILRAKLSEQDRACSRLRSRRQQAEQNLDAEQRSYAQQETALAAVEQQLQRSAP